MNQIKLGESGERLHVDWSTNRSYVKSSRKEIDINARTVLVVDDQRSVRRSVSRLIRACEPKIVIFEAGHGAEAMKRLSEIRARYVNDPSLIVLDLDMPVMDGWDVISHLKQEYEAGGRDSGIPIVVLSATSGDKGIPLFRKSVHTDASLYVPMVTVSKDSCMKKQRYDAAGEEELATWIRHFVRGPEEPRGISRFFKLK